MVRRHHPVLAVISNCYSEAKGRFPRVTHPCATRPEGLVRLACVRHAASVRSEPGSNSQVLSKYLTARVNPLTARYLTSGADTCTCQTYGYVRTCIGIDLVTGFRGPKTLRTGRRRPHVPSSKLTMSKNHQTEIGGQPWYPDFPTGGLGVRLCWRPVEEEANRRFRPEGPTYGGGTESSNGFCNFLKQSGYPLGPASSPCTDSAMALFAARHSGAGTVRDLHLPRKGKALHKPGGWCQRTIARGQARRIEQSSPPSAISRSSPRLLIPASQSAGSRGPSRSGTGLIRCWPRTRHACVVIHCG